MDDITLYPIHRLNGIAQYAGHVILWGTDEATARTIATAMCVGPIVGVELVRVGSFILPVGEREKFICTIGLTYDQAVDGQKV